jgi:hypothetical protein
MSSAEAQRLERWSRLLGSPVISVQRVRGGRNSQAYRGVCASGRSFFAKAYYRDERVVRDRLAVEVASLRFCRAHGIRSVPEVLAVDEEGSTALFEYVDGEPFKSESITDADIDHAASFLADLRDLGAREVARTLPPASEAFFSWRSVLDSVQARYERVALAPERSPEDRALHDFLRDEFVPAWRDARGQVRRELGDIDLEIPLDERTLSPSDFGFHNALRAPGQGIVYVDFEYFGWDDPAKTAADFLLHPGHELALERKRRFVHEFLRHFPRPDTLGERIRIAFRVFGLKWCLILLNEFVLSDVRRREFSLGPDGDWERLLQGQLEKARSMLSQATGAFPV